MSEPSSLIAKVFLAGVFVLNVMFAAYVFG